MDDALAPGQPIVAHLESHRLPAIAALGRDDGVLPERRADAQRVPDADAPMLAAAMPDTRRLTVTTSIDAALDGADAVMALRLQQERMSSGLLPSLREYAARYQLNTARMARATPEAIVLHPGPMNEGVEIAADLAAGGRSVISEQVANGVAIRMAVLYLVAGGRSAGVADG